MDFILIGSTEIGVAHSESFEYFKGAGFRLRGDGVGFSSEYWKRLGLTGGFNRDTAINYFPAAGLAPFRGESLKGNAGVTWRPGQRLRFANSYLYTRLARGPAVVFTNHIARSKVYYQFNREFSLRLTLDYSAVLADTRLASEEPAKRFNTDLLVTWLLNPGTAVYFGYSDLRENRLLFRPGFTGGSPDLNTGRQVFVKLSYLIRR